MRQTNEPSDRPGAPHPGVLPAGAGELSALVHEKDWSKTSLGPMAQWSLALRMMVDFLLVNRFPLLLWWGPDYISIYNDAYRPVLGEKHPAALGQPCSAVWPEIDHILRPLIDSPFNGGPATWMDDIPLEINRHGFAEETHFTIAYSPVPDASAPRGIGGVLATVHEITEKVIGERRIVALRDLGAGVAEGRTTEEASSIAARALRSHEKDIPFSMIYLLAARGGDAWLAASSGVPDDSLANMNPEEAVRGSGKPSGWRFAEVLETRSPVTVENLDSLFSRVPPGPWSDPPHTALVLPIRSGALNELAGFLVAGVSPRLRLDDAYRGFLDLVAAQIAAGVASARAYEEERERAEALAEIDRAKTAFFSNVSHEFRTPLSLMLGPLTDALERGDALDAGQLQLVHRNALRLLKLVNSLLEFSRIEAGRAQAIFAATDLAAFTAELASNFRSACQRAGLDLRVDCAPLSAPAYLDRDMWEKIVLNLLSNAFKFTFEGAIAVSLKENDGNAELSVSDTGVGIPPEEIGRLFERFHRIEGQRSRTHEGSGIGLALVLELVKLHGGSMSVDSVVDRGTTFTVRVPFGSKALLAANETRARLPSTSVTADAFVQEALRWLPDQGQSTPLGFEAQGETLSLRQGARVLLADDNADMRAYVGRLIGTRCEVRAVADGAAALREVRRHKPDLILADVMMPEMDGFALLREVRSDASLRDIPFILLSARAGEESRVEGLDAGANDYLVKPFSARELVARVSANLELARVRSEAAAALRESEQRYRTLVTASSYAVCRMNADWTEMPGLEEEGSIADIPGPSGSRLGAHIHPDDRPLAAAAIERAIATKTMFEREYRVRRADGSFGWTHLRAVPRLDEDGNIAEWFGAANDVSDRKFAEAALKELNETLEQRVSTEFDRRLKAENALRQSQKMEAIGQLTSGLAHDFNNLLTAVGGSLSLIERRLSDGKPGVERYIRAGQDAVRRAATLTQRLLAFSRQQSLDPKPVDANRLIAEMEELIRRTVPPNIEVATIGAAGLWPIEVDAIQLESSLLNLCINARDAMTPQGGRLTVETANTWLDTRDARDHDLPAGQYVSIRVTDTGTGMAPEVIERAFDPFFTTKPVGQGTGLGLSMVYGFVRQSGGQVRIDSEVGKGAAIVLYLPRFTGEPEEARPADGSARAQPGNGETILVVDDEPTLRMLVSEVLDEHGYNVKSAKSGATALEALRSDAEIDLLITDVGLPGGMSGRQLADETRKLRPGLKILFITGFAENAAVGRERLGIDMGVLTKPFEIASLAAKVKEMLEHQGRG